MRKYKMIVADDHDLYRDGIKHLLRKMKNIILVGEARDGKEAVDLYAKLNPELVLLDISMPVMDGMEASVEILRINPSASIIILSMHSDEDYISRCLSAGVKGYVIKSETSDELRNTIESVIQGNNYVSRKAQDVILNSMKQLTSRGRSSSETANITQREIEILRYITQGFTSQEMAEKLFISIRTVETHRANLMRKLGVKNAIELVKKSIELGLLN